MSRIAYVNGAYAPLNAPLISVMDRGLQLADSIYEVWAVRGGRLYDAEAHMARLWRSLDELRIAHPMSEASLWAVMRETMRRNRVRDGIVYVQVSRGAAPRDHVFPSAAVRPTLIVTAKNLDQRAIAARVERGVRVISAPETRWARRDIKSVNLLPNVLARQAAKEAGAFEAWFVDDDGFVTEGTSSSAWIVDAAGSLRTRALSTALLHGVTRAALIGLARERQLAVVEAPFTIADALAAREAFISSASNPAVGVVTIDGRPVGDGKVGPVTRTLNAVYLGA
ncbi:MAG TPA: D-amino-acid transaminase [Vitreimonas sp.]|uniref:D-amino-acid transaminase n=1 Tax=Vitreimonas sp. TaxID=3069702 RepID=UPI002D33C5E6|nr:D-amino-acid transaminase [Vitreimonas sp.]HYD87459.1 D-amino-acid transaminase [Vitreimonas sp.]